MTRHAGRVPWVRALSKLCVSSRSRAAALIRESRVRVDGAEVTNPRMMVVPERVEVAVDDAAPTRGRPARRVIAFHKPRGVVTTRRDPEGRPTVFEWLGKVGEGLIAVGRLDLASSGLLLLTNDTQLANALTDPARASVRRYVVTVRGRVTPDEAAELEAGLEVPGGRGRSRERDRLGASRVELRTASNRETHLVVDLVEGKNRELRRLFDAVGHEVTRLHRIRFGDATVDGLAAGAWRDVTGLYNTSRPNLRSQRSASRQPGHTDSTSRQKRRE